MIKITSDPEKRRFTTSETVLLVIMTLVIGVLIGSLLSKTNVITKTMTTKDENLNKFINTYEYVINNYYENVDKEKLISNAIDGMLKSLDDPYSMYLDKDESENFSISLDGSYKGVGIQVAKEEDGYIIVTYVFKDSPADKAGLKTNDIIIEIDGESCKDYSASDFSEKIKKSEKENFKLKILREEKEIEVILKKDVITLESILTETYERNDKKIGYIYIGIFANNTYYQFKDALDELEKQKIDSLIIDVRGNSGGHLTAVDSILDIFLTEKDKMYGFSQNKKKNYVYGTGDKYKDYEIVLLGDEGSASASEVLIAGLMENLNSKFFGKKTFGKGTVQEMINLSDGDQYKLTIKKWLTPKGNWINDTKGIVPSKEVELDDEYFETYESSDDTQLEYAIEYLAS